MGYDMSITTGSTEEEQAALEAYVPKIAAAQAELNKHERGTEEWKAAAKEVDRLYDEKYSLPSEYFRLNIWGMGYARDYMMERGMIYPSRCPEFPALPYPERENFKTGHEYDNACEDWDRNYEELTAPIKELHPEGGDTIPAHKFGSNDGWLVTEAECAAAVAAAKASDLPAPTRTEDGLEVAVSWWPEWVDFLDRASTRGGFLVY